MVVQDPRSKTNQAQKEAIGCPRILLFALLPSVVRRNVHKTALEARKDIGSFIKEVQILRL